MKLNYYLEKKPEEETGVKALMASLLVDGTGTAPVRDGVVVVDGTR